MPYVYVLCLQDLPHQEITPHWLGSDETRAFLAVYCLKDAVLPSRLVARLLTDVQYIEMANVARVPVNFLISKGQGVKVQAQLYAAARRGDPHYILPYMPVTRTDNDAVSYEGAHVFEPRRGYYDVPIVTLDFASLYPSIMMAHNLCYSTHVLGSPEGLDCERTPRGDYFVRPHVRRGLLPQILDDLLQARREAKRAMAAEQDPFRKSVLDGRQLALKVSANSGASVGSPHTRQRALLAEQGGHNAKISGRHDQPKHCSHGPNAPGSPLRKCTRTGRFTCTAQNTGPCIESLTPNAVFRFSAISTNVHSIPVYGFTGATVGKLPDLGISASVTAYGRDMIQLCEKVLAEHYPGTETIYGDTDSVMVRFAGVNDMETAIARGKEAAQLLTSYFTPPIKLEFEKVFWPYLLVNKKRYAGLHWEKADAPSHINKKGIESVRRDNCPLVPRVLDEVLERLLRDRDPDGAVAVAKRVVADLLQHKVPLEELTISKEYSKPAGEYAAVQAHIVLAERMARRDASTAPKMGDRIMYVMVGAAGKHPKAYERVEDPRWARQHGIPVDPHYYIERQLKKPLLRLLQPVLGERAEAEIFRGPHTRRIVQRLPKRGGLVDYFGAPKK